MALIDKYFELAESESPSNERVLKATKITESSSHRIALDSSGRVHILVDTFEVSSEPNIELNWISVSFATHCCIQNLNGTTENKIYTILTLKEDDIDVIEFFLKIVSQLILESPLRLKRREIKEKIDYLIQLFEQVEQNGKNILGLWGELFVIFQSSNIASSLDRWHSDPNGRFDFYNFPDAKEVKITEKPQRIHTFRHEQLRTDELNISIISLMTSRVSSGFSVADLINAIESKINSPDLVRKLYSQSVRIGGRGVFDGRLKFDQYQAEESYRVINANTIPVPIIPTNAPISNLRYAVEISSFVD